MRFTAIIGNPPYQMTDGGGGAGDSAVPVYDRFVTHAKALEPRYISLVMPSKWMVGGRRLQEFRREMCEDTSLRSLFDFEDDAEVFGGMHIDGGVCYFLRDAAYHGNPEIRYQARDGEVVQSRNSLRNAFFDYVVRDYRIISVLEKTSRSGKKFAEIVSRYMPFGIRAYLFNQPERYPESHLSASPFEGSVKVYGVRGIKGGARRTHGFVSPSIIMRNHSHVALYKIFFSKCFSTDAVHPPEPILGMPGEICTETFLEIGPFVTQKEQLNCYSYMQTWFFKFLLFYGKGTMNVTPSVFQLIPMQDFSDRSDINWNLGVDEIDRQLFDKYRLDSRERKIIRGRREFRAGTGEGEQP